MHMKHDNIIYFDSFLWNWSCSIVCDDALFMAFCINKAIHDKICWPTLAERLALVEHIAQLHGCIGFVDGTLIKIHRPYENPDHNKWYQLRTEEDVLYEQYSTC